MLAHPAVIARLLWMVGPGFYSYFASTPSLLVMNPGNAGGIQHGGWLQPNPMRAWWTQENGRTFTDSLNVAWQLHDVPPNSGGFVVVPGKTNQPTNRHFHNQQLQPASDPLLPAPVGYS